MTRWGGSIPLALRQIERNRAYREEVVGQQTSKRVKYWGLLIVALALLAWGVVGGVGWLVVS